MAAGSFRYQSTTLRLCAFLSLFAAGCAPAEGSPGEGEPLDSARLAQIDPGWHGGWRHFTVTFEDDTLFAGILVTGESVSGYDSYTEYWYVNASSLGELGTQDLIFRYDDGENAPPSLSGEQEFTQPANVTWAYFSSDPVSGGNLYSNGTIHLRIIDDSSEITRITWYQTIVGESPANVTPDGTFTAGTGSVSVPSGQNGYHVDASVD